MEWSRCHRSLCRSACRRAAGPKRFLLLTLLRVAAKFSEATPKAANKRPRQNRFDETLRLWTQTSTEGRAVPGFGSAADSAEQASLAAFDSAAGQQGSCDPQRKALQDQIRKNVLRVYAQQRVIAERQAQADLNRKLLNKMTQRGGPLRIQEKMDILEDSVDDYKASVRKLLPSWAQDMVDTEEGATERRLGELQFLVEDSREGLALQKKWEDRRMRDLMSKRAYGVSVSFDPALRVLVRPEGLGNLQVFSEGPLGPPSHPASVNFGVWYREAVCLDDGLLD
ncbi:unnamed protein product [Symbiodinium pilosum]|uniref:Uncharacterized protein n=1 Tax=Symbiodinium pilosum TaxID=2952 RepID=A0A812PP99_SYMPI|nr:unnamed protein product [Symbiodinium pilosum]